MQVIVADTGPIHYLVLIGCVDILPAMFGGVTLPSVVGEELADVEAPAEVREWIKKPPSWLTVLPVPTVEFDDAVFGSLDKGEKAVIAMAASLNADLVLMDDRDGVTVARGKGLTVTGTLGVLELAARRRLVDLRESFARLRMTNFRYRQEIMDAILSQHSDA